MASDKGRGRGKHIFKNLGIALVILLGFVGFAFIEVAMSGVNLDNPPSQGLIWLLMVMIDMAVVVGLIKLIQRA